MKQYQLNLADMAAFHGLDKGLTAFEGHGYTRVYEAILANRRDLPLRVLEIGLLHPESQSRRAGGEGFDDCPSLDLWADYLSKAEIFGFDLCDFARYRRPRVAVYQVDQGERRPLTEIAAGCGGAFDLIVDDGSHASHHQQISLGVLFPFLNPGGWYVIEDLHFQPADIERPERAKTRELLRRLEASGSFGEMPYWFTPEEAARLEQETQTISFFDSLARFAPEGTFAGRDALVALQRRPTAVGPLENNVCALARRVRSLLGRLSGDGFSWWAGRPLWLWGAGSGGRRVEQLLRAVDAPVAGYLDSSPALHGQLVNGLPVSPPVGLRSRESHCPYLLICSVHYSEIESKLREFGWRPGADYLVIDFERVRVAEAALPSELGAS